MEPGNYAEYPRPSKGEVDFSVIGEAFQLVFKHPGPMMVAATLGYLIPAIIATAISMMMQVQLGMMSPTAQTDINEMFSDLGKLYGAQIPLMIGQIVLMAPFGYAITNMTLKSLQGQPVGWGDVFSGFPKFFQSVGLSLLTSLAAIVGLLACCIGSPLLGGLLMLSMPYMVDKRMGVMEAMAKSFETMRPHMWLGMLMFVVYAILASIGAVACLIGIIVTFPLFYVVPALVYRDVERTAMTPSV